jgi:pseudouridine synthase
MSSERLQKLIARAGVASRRAAEQLILDGEVTVNGRVVRELGSKADPSSDHIKVRGKLLLFTAPPLYVMLNKPSGYVTTAKDPQGRPTVMDLLRGVRGRVFPVGRLDFDSEGLLLLTNDGALAQALMHPSHEVPKTYTVKIKGKVEDADIAKLEAGGMVLDTGRTAPCKVRRVREGEANAWLEVTLREGKKRQVRLMLERIGHPVSKLIRTRYANLSLGELPLGHTRFLTPEEVRGLRTAATGAMAPRSATVPRGAMAPRGATTPRSAMAPRKATVPRKAATPGRAATPRSTTAPRGARSPRTRKGRTRVSSRG